MNDVTLWRYYFIAAFKKTKTVNFKTVKNPIVITHKDIRLTKMNEFYSSEHGIMPKIEPKVTRVDPKNTKKRPFYDIKLFCVTKCDRESIIYRFYLQIIFIFFIFQVLRMLTQRCYGHITLGLCRPLGELFALDKIYLTRNVQK